MADTVRYNANLELGAGPLSVANADDASSKTTGAVKVAGGIGVEKKVHVGQTITSDSGDLKLVAGTLHVENGNTATQGDGSGKATGVTINHETGQITMDDASLASGAVVTFAVANSKVAATDVAIVNHVSGGTVGGYLINAQGFASETFNITVTNLTSGALTDALVLRFVIVKGSHT